MKDILEIEKDLIPYDFEVLLGDELYEIEVNYNGVADFFTLALKKDGEIVSAGEPLIYGVPLFTDTYMLGKHPAIMIVPLDESGHENRVGWDNLGKTVFLCIDDEGEEDVEQ